MEIEEALTAYLMDIQNLTALIGDKLYPEEIPQGVELPAIIYMKISDIKEHTLIAQSSMERPIFQFTILAGRKDTARGITNKIKEALCDYQGIMSGLQIQYIMLLNELSNLNTSSNGTIKVYTEILEFEINYIKE